MLSNTHLIRTPGAEKAIYVIARNVDNEKWFYDILDKQSPNLLDLPQAIKHVVDKATNQTAAIASCKTFLNSRFDELELNDLTLLSVPFQPNER